MINILYPMRSSLFDLIESLSKPEKRFFMLESSRYSSKNTKGYLEVYKFLEKQSVYDDNVFKSHFSDSSFAKRLPQVKNYLYNLILKILIKFNAQKSIDFEITELLQSVDVLFTKGLYKQAEKLLRKAKKYAAKYNIVSHLIRIYEWEHNFALIENPFTKVIEKGKAFLLEKDRLIQDLNNYYEYEKIYYSICEFLFATGRKSTKLSPEVYAIHKLSLLHDDKKLSSWQVKNIFYFIHSAFYFFDGQFEKTLYYTQLRVGIYEVDEKFLVEKTKQYLDAAYNNIQALISNKKFDDALSQIEVVQKMTGSVNVPMSEQSKNLLFTIYYTHHIRLLLEYHDYKSVIILGEQLKKNDKSLVAKKEQDKTYFIVLRQIASAHFILGQNKEAIYWLDLILDNVFWTGSRSDLIGFIRMFYIILHFEDENYRILEYYINITERYLLKHKILFLYERTLISFFRKISRYTLLKDKQKNEFIKVKEQLRKIKQKKNAKNPELEQIYIEAWIDSKILKIPVYEILTMKGKIPDS